ncbi:hypothetical protein GCM10020254_77200 [Streptomyces goshikiensis]
MRSSTVSVSSWAVPLQLGLPLAPDVEGAGQVGADVDPHRVALAAAGARERGDEERDAGGGVPGHTDLADAGLEGAGAVHGGDPEGDADRGAVRSGAYDMGAQRGARIHPAEEVEVPQGSWAKSAGSFRRAASPLVQFTKEDRICFSLSGSMSRTIRGGTDRSHPTLPQRHEPFTEPKKHLWTEPLIG